MAGSLKEDRTYAAMSERDLGPTRIITTLISKGGI